MTKLKTNYYCPECGSGNIYVDTTMSWDVKEQKWEAGDPCGRYICNQCEDEFRDPDDGFVDEKGYRVNEDGTAYVADHDEDEDAENV